MKKINKYLIFGIATFIGCNFAFTRGDKDRQINIVTSNENINSVLAINDSFCFEYVNNNSFKDFSMKIIVDSLVAKGYFCFIYSNGGKIDCDPNVPNFIVRKDSLFNFTYNFFSNYCGKYGLMRLDKLGDTALLKIIEKPDSSFFGNQAMKFVKCK